MFERIKKARQQERQGGFTLIELLVVIAILGILAAIVVFSVAGVQDKGQLASCKIDTQTLQTAEEANFAAAAPVGGSYVSMAQLVTNGFLSTQSTLHGITANPAGSSPPSYMITEASNTCGTSGHAVGNIPAGTTSPPATNVCTTGTAAGTGTGGWGDC